MGEGLEAVDAVGGQVDVKGLNALIGTAVHPDVGAGDRRHPAAEGLDQLGPRCGVVRRRHVRDREAVRRLRADRGPAGFGVLHRRRGRRDRSGRRPVLHHRPAERSVRVAIATIAEHAWTPIHYPNAIFDDQVGGWISDAEVAETSYTAFTSRGRTGR